MKGGCIALAFWEDILVTWILVFGGNDEQCSFMPDKVIESITKSIIASRTILNMGFTQRAEDQTTISPTTNPSFVSKTPEVSYTTLYQP